MKLYDYFRSSAAYRVRIALNLKELDYQQSAVNLLKGEQGSEDYKTINPQELVPTLTTDQGELTQSLAIIEWLEEAFPERSIIPGDPWKKARLRSLAYLVSCDIHPINNLRVLKYLQQKLAVSDDAKTQWYKHWIHTGFTALEAQLDDQPFCCSEQPSIADICLVPQVFNALRFKVEMSDFSKIQEIYKHCNTQPAFIDAAPENQPDAV
ncbi:maleylacetoacetate isomerase [Endozoicomonas sp. SCSIO W0465]|uniref:maleylacetoacetate isomerase n=1 Tax=Endozoicomonas sp. SCSIO W0465 TaxID=2918516 RepID=UPI002074B360|nr:maleylacetoacetate isomerase [Endozoicomonas sp. SCSIO W0465]USE35117.1 maleylacetoacetate isomerase [Endozoicomonas sp. SCSIO W0465]